MKTQKNMRLNALLLLQSYEQLQKLLQANTVRSVPTEHIRKLAREKPKSKPGTFFIFFLAKLIGFAPALKKNKIDVRRLSMWAITGLPVFILGV